MIGPFLAYLGLTMLLEAPWFLWGFRQRSARHRVAVWAAANVYSYPAVFFYFPYLGWPDWQWVLAAEIWAPLCELCVAAFLLSGLTRREALAIVLANLFSWGVGHLLFWR